MPKREKTPPPGDDEPKYLSIYYPYPPHSTLDEDKNVKECARWISCFVGKDNLFSLFHKPSSPNVIIAEVNPELTDQKMRNILGEHEWSEVFVNIESEDITSSKVFYSTFNSRREVEKTGWKAIDIGDQYFKNFNPTKGGKIVYPYPATHFCEPPLLTGEVSALKLFRYLPTEIFPEARVNQQAPAPQAPVAPVRVVPGSAPALGGNNSTGGKGKKGKKKGNRIDPSIDSNLDPTVRPTAPLTRSMEASAKAKAVHRQLAPVTPAMYDEDSDDDGANYMAAHPGPGPANWNGSWADESKKEEEEYVDEKYEEPEESPVQSGLAARFAGVKIKDDDGPLCPHHNKRCKSGICEWAREQKRKEKLIQSRNTGRTGQNQRQW
ncbi:hypothetical protein FRC07_001033 [Ceratobasidium sp. 392]|nr:hypothetical protein FRC07_001033 [Ceratobasidium sp. 392]